MRADERLAKVLYNLRAAQALYCQSKDQHHTHGQVLKYLAAQVDTAAKEADKELALYAEQYNGS